ncbi:hypothetical protein BGM25_25655 [Bacillus sp. FJAT-29953]|nr:hypothetical protein [Bacillus sp. FJAT-29953]
MGIRTGRQYLESLNDGRIIYYKGRRIEDVTTDPFFTTASKHAAALFELQEIEEYKDLTTVTLPSGEAISRFYATPRTSDDLIKRMELTHLTNTRALGVDNSVLKAIGSNAINALLSVTKSIDGKKQTNYHERVQNFLRYCQENDIASVLAETDPKGDRGVAPSQQVDPDLYLRIVSRNEEGIVVRGAKVAITFAQLANEMIVLPSRTVKEEDAEYAVAFSIPANHPGVKQIVQSPVNPENLDPFDRPLSSRQHVFESTIFFEDVFVPWDRVFMAGEWEFSRELLVKLSTFLRFGAIAAKPSLAELLVGTAQMMAEYNGLEKAQGIQNKIAELMAFAGTIKSLTKLAALDCQIIDGVAVPNLETSNMAKYYIGSNFHNMINIVQDIGGAGVLTAPYGADFDCPETGDLVRKYYQGKQGIPAEHRVRMFRLINDLTASDFGGHQLVTALHGEGSPMAQKITIYREYNLNPAREIAMRAARITG